MAKRWYVVHAFSGFEKQVQRSLTERIERAGMQDLFGEILVPTEEVVEMKGGQKRRSERKFYPGYVLVEMEMTDETWHLVKDVPKVMGFIGGTADRPAPISKNEADYNLNRVQEAELLERLVPFQDAFADRLAVFVGHRGIVFLDAGLALLLEEPDRLAHDRTRSLVEIARVECAGIEQEHASSSVGCRCGCPRA